MIRERIKWEAEKKIIRALMDAGAFDGLRNINADGAQETEGAAHLPAFHTSPRGSPAAKRRKGAGGK